MIVSWFSNHIFQAFWVSQCLEQSEYFWKEKNVNVAASSILTKFQ